MGQPRRNAVLPATIPNHTLNFSAKITKTITQGEKNDAKTGNLQVFNLR